jgi:iron-sulfur cluster repair protein YtfE (RIC family)
MVPRPSSVKVELEAGEGEGHVTIRDPIEHLLRDHVEIMRDIDALRRALRTLEVRGEPAVAEALPALQAVGRMMATQLLLHARLEDEALFPAVESALGAAGGPTAVMREEHREIHAEAERFRATLRELREVEHPSIVSGGERLRGLASGGGSAEELRATGAEIVRLLDSHFGKEEAILFPMAREILGVEELAAVARRMEEIS